MPSGIFKKRITRLILFFVIDGLAITAWQLSQPDLYRPTSPPTALAAATIAPQPASTPVAASALFTPPPASRPSPVTQPTPTPVLATPPPSAGTPTPQPSNTPIPAPLPLPAASPQPAPEATPPPASEATPVQLPVLASVPEPLAPAIAITPSLPEVQQLLAPPAPPVVSPAQRAVAWAIAELHSPDPSWSNQMQRPWSGYCEAFVEIAYGTRYHFATARAHYLAQLAAGRIQLDAHPPAGAVVFYGGGSAGHVALAIGGDQVITTWGYASDRYPIKQIRATGLSNSYLGWALTPL